MQIDGQVQECPGRVAGQMTLSPGVESIAFVSDMQTSVERATTQRSTESTA